MDVKRIVIIVGCLSGLAGCYSAPYSPDTGYTQGGYYNGGYAAAPGYYAPPVAITVRPER